MNRIITFLFTALLSTAAGAQGRSGALQGEVTDGSQKIVESATISLLRATDSSLVKMSMADASGHYRFEGLVPGSYLVSVSALGHETAWSAPQDLKEAASVKVPTLNLLPVTKALTGVTVTARRPMVELKAGKMIVNVDASISNVGATALEVLEKSPGVTVDKDGNISIKGKQGIQVLLDGRPAYLSGTELANYLKGMPASAIDQIEIMTNPSSKYDASGNSGIINIRSKKNRSQGFNGNLSLSLTQGRLTQYNNSLNLNYRNGKVNLFANINHNHGNHWQNLDLLRRYRNETTGEQTAIFQQESRMRNQNDNISAKLGVDYTVSKKTTIGLVLNGMTNPEQFQADNTSYLENAHGSVDSIVFAQDANKQRFHNGSVNLNIRHRFDTSGRELTADVDVVHYRIHQDGNFTNTAFDPSWVKQSFEQLRSALPVDIRIYSAKTDYTHPFKGGARMEAGLKTSFVQTENSAFYYNVRGSSEQVDTSKTNRFNYKEQISAAYLNMSKDLGKWSLQGGLRYELTAYEGRQFGSPDQQLHADSSFKRTYGSLFPTAFVSYNAGKSHQFTFSYGRRIDRPAYQDMNPFLFFLDKYTYQQGNPFMKPQFTHNFELAHTFKGWLNTTINYSTTKDLLNETFQPAKDAAGNNTYATTIKNGNIGSWQSAGIAMNAQVTVTKWWTSSIYANYNYNHFTGKLNGDGAYINVSGSNLTMNMNNQLRFNNGWSAELSGFYRTRGIEGQVVILPFGQVSAGIGKQVFKGSGTIKLAMRDAFFTSQQDGMINLENTEVHFHQKRDTQAGVLSFSWRFGKPAKDSAPRHKSGADDELNRVKGGH